MEALTSLLKILWIDCSKNRTLQYLQFCSLGIKLNKNIIIFKAILYVRYVTVKKIKIRLERQNA